MTQEQQRIEVYSSLMQILDSFMVQYQVPASMMEDALNKILVSIKDQVVSEFINAVIQDNIQAQNQPEGVHLAQDNREEDGN